MNYDLAENVFKKHYEFHYAQNTTIDESIYPHVHDFYEILLISHGSMYFKLNNHELNLTKGDLILIKPGDIHSKKYLNNESLKTINLAFPNQIIESLFQYVYGSDDYLTRLTQSKNIIMCKLRDVDNISLQNKISFLDYISTNEWDKQNRYLRAILVDIILFILIGSTSSENRNEFPKWLNNILEGLDDIQNLRQGLDYILTTSDRTQSHVCRTFVKFLDMTPTTYINEKRLNYAANLLAHSDKEIIDISFETGFNSIGNFYNLFKKQYRLSPLKYRNKYSFNTQMRE